MANGVIAIGKLTPFEGSNQFNVLELKGLHQYIEAWTSPPHCAHTLVKLNPYLRLLSMTPSRDSPSQLAYMYPINEEARISANPVNHTILGSLDN